MAETPDLKTSEQPVAGSNSDFVPPVQSGTPNPLTCIRDAYTLAATQEPDGDEVNKLMVNNFLNILAEVALAVASRKGSG